MRSRYFALRILALIIVVIIFISGCVEKQIDLTKELSNESKTEIQDFSKESKISAELPKGNKTEVNTTPEEHKEIIPIATPEQIGSRLIKWTKEEGIRTSGVSSSTIIKNNEYWMYYTGNGIELATSTDGLNFVNRRMVIEYERPGSGQEMVSNPAVFKLLDGRYRIIYEGSRWAENEKGERNPTDRKLYSAISTDGKEWTKEEGVRFWDYSDGKSNELFTSVPDIIRLSSGKLRMYYTRGATSATALSNDEGLTWTKETDLKLKKVAIDLDVVLLEDGAYKLFFTTFEDEFGIGDQWVMSASSTDGLNFVIGKGKLIEPSTSGGLITDPDVIKTDNGYRMYYGEFKKGEHEPNIMSAFSLG